MANEFENALRSAATSVASYVKDASTMQVETQYVEIGDNGAANFDQARPVARTLIKLDGDSAVIVPVRKNEAGLMEVDAGLFDLHQQNVATAIEYRARILNSLLGTFTSRIATP
jgi:hypothetical protein